ncbi:serine protease [Kitasatospora sp. NPDC088134]|uniref:serine protease n=1 Tax=Kitasatospora sp. NPDC088134 TaxID=3364071 RepID=UPI00381EB9F9
MTTSFVRRCAAAALAATAVFAASSPATAVVGGHAVAAGQAPYLVALQNGPRPCGGTVVDATTVLTAAHCVAGARPAGMSVRAGSLSRTSGGRTAAVAEIRLHPDYDAQAIDYDLAIVKLATPLVLDGKSTAALPLIGSGEHLGGGTVVTAYGWGATAEGGAPAATAQQADVPVVANDTCKQRYEGFNDITDRMLCAGADTTGDACQGDSGSPLVHDGRLAALVSWGYGCGRSAYPGVYTDIAELRPWIDANRGPAAPAAPAHAPTAAPVGADHGCPADSVCLYKTDDDYRNNRPAVSDNLALRSATTVTAIPAGGYAEIVNNTRPVPEYSSEGTIVAGLLGLCVYLPAETESPGTDTATASGSVDTLVVGPTQASVGSLIVPCPAQ